MSWEKQSLEKCERFQFFYTIIYKLAAFIETGFEGEPIRGGVTV